MMASASPGQPRFLGGHGPAAGQDAEDAGAAAQVQADHHVVAHAERGEHARLLERPHDTAPGDVARAVGR